MKEKAAINPVVAFSDKNNEAKITSAEEGEDTVLVALESDTPLPPRHPLPDEVIMINETNSTNPFLTDVFQQKKTEDQATKRIMESDKVQSDPANNKTINLKANFTPFKKSKIGDKTPAKMKVFLPGTGGDESDFDFSFNDPDFDSSLCAETHEGAEEN